MDKKTIITKLAMGMWEVFPDYDPSWSDAEKQEWLDCRKELMEFSLDVLLDRIPALNQPSWASKG